MNWDDKLIPIFITIVAGAIGAISAGVANAYAANRKIKEVELQYMHRIRDGYLSNARSVVPQIYIPISISITNLFNCYERFASTIGITPPAYEKAFRDDFETECLRFLETINQLFQRGAEAYLTSEMDEFLTDFTNFLGNSLDQKEIRRRKILRLDATAFGFSTSQIIDNDHLSKPQGREFIKPGFSVRLAPLMFFRSLDASLTYSEKVLAAPLDSKEFEQRMRTEVPRIKALIKQVTLGSSPLPSMT